jgi:hypothetical protein
LPPEAELVSVARDSSLMARAPWGGLFVLTPFFRPDQMSDARIDQLARDMRGPLHRGAIGTL